VYVIDASVHVADARPQEPHHAEARALLARVAAQNLPVLLPEIVLAEIAAAVSRGTDQIALAQRLVATLRRVPQFEFVPIEHTLGDLAAEIAAQYQIRGCDAVYVALAEQRNVTLISLDHRQLERVPAHIVAQSPAEELARMVENLSENPLQAPVSGALPALGDEG
jgi:predicted nucleic acid-binding protein